MPRLLDTEKFPLVSPGIARCHVPAERRQRMGAAACLCFCGAAIDIAPGDVVVLPAGTGHQCLMASPDLVVVGAYPPSGKYNLCRASKAEHAKALTSIPKVPRPATDPVFGPKGPLIALWRAPEANVESLLDACCSSSRKCSRTAAFSASTKPFLTPAAG